MKNIICIVRFFLILTLPLLFVSLVSLSYLKIVDIGNISLHTLYIIMIIFLIFILFIPHNAYISECKIRGRLDETRKELEQALDKTSLTIDGETKSVMSVREFLEEFFHNVRNDNFANIASSTFPMLGILGTFIAIAISMPDFTVSNAKELDNQISHLLSGVGTAFYASIFGIFLSLLWNFFEKYGLSKIERLTSTLENLYAKYIWSKKELLKFQYSQKTIFENEFIRSLKDVFDMEFIKEINREHIKSYEKIMKMTNANFKEMESSLSRTNSELMHSLHRVYLTKEALDAQILLQENLKEFNKNSQTLKDALENFESNLAVALGKVDSELAKSVMHIQKMSQIIRKDKKE